MHWYSDNPVGTVKMGWHGMDNQVNKLVLLNPVVLFTKYKVQDLPYTRMVLN